MNTDVLLPIIIFSVVRANPVHLVSQLLFIQRYRSRHVGGEESFCLINFLAVVEFLGASLSHDNVVPFDESRLASQIAG